MKKSFVIQENIGAMLNALAPDLAGKVVQIMYRYQCGESEESLAEIDATAYGIFLSAKGQMDRDNAKYAAKVAAGRKGGEAKAENARCSDSTDVANDSKSVAKRSKQVANDADKEKVNRFKDKEKEKESPTEINNPPISPLKRGYSPDPALDDAIHDFIRHRKALKKPMTDKAVELFVAKLNKLAPGDNDKQIRLINTAIERGWQSVYEEKNIVGMTKAQQTHNAQVEALARIYQEG